MNFNGILVGAATFLLIGLFHPIVIKAEYYFSKKCWPVFLVVGLALMAVSLWIADTTASILVSIVGISCLWSIKELFEQEKRVKKGWFPANPKRNRRHSQP